MQEIRHTPAAPTTVRLLPPGRGIGAHRHDEHQIVYAGSGVVTVTTDAGTWVAPGTRALWIPAGTVHAHRSRGHLELHMVGLPADDNPLGLLSPAVLSVSPLLRELIIACTGPSARPGTPQTRRLFAVLRDQLRVTPQHPVHLPTPDDPRLRALCEAFSRDPADSRPLAALGAEIGVSARTLSRLFRSDLGMTFPQWRTQFRLLHALELLTEDRPVTAVAHACGWSSASAFIDVFRAAFGRTPGTYERHTPGTP